VRFGITLPNAGLGDSPTVLADLAAEAEVAGWDGVFVWDAGVPDHDIAQEPDDPALAAVVDPWIAMALMAAATQRVTIGPMIAPLARRRPWKVAQECVTLDHLSRGRFVLPVGLGWTPDAWFRAVGEPVDIRARAERLDEALAIIDALWRGDEVTVAGRHYQVDGLRLRPLPMQQPRIPIWVVGGWPSGRSLRRAARWDGVIPQRIRSQDPLEPRELTELVTQVSADRTSAGHFDVVVEGMTPERDRAEAASYARGLADAGATWYLEAVWIYMYETPGRPDAIRRRIRAGPPARDT
jgi:alkanesulfonate monooxygenase SsuD/methylene tetrahydromethanopterin reductase-like flavin-dependent oxidoreductase (luciferase family)